jgi:transcriptional regulator with XRE-family HTH domain
MPIPVKPDLLSDDHPTPAQLRAGRALLGWSQANLAAAAGISPRTLKAIELAPDLAPAPGRPATLLRLLHALEKAGVSLHRGKEAVGVSRRMSGQPPGPVPGTGGKGTDK